MKKYLLFAVLFSVVFVSCESSDETILNETKSSSHAKNEKESMYDIYQNVMSSYKYDTLLTYNDNLTFLESHVNSFFGNDQASYENIDAMQLAYIIQSPNEVVEKLNYSTEFKDALHVFLNERKKHSIVLLDEKEEVLMQNLYILFHNDKDSDDYLKKNIKTVAFAYGSQYSLTKAILYSGAIEIIQ